MVCHKKFQKKLSDKFSGWQKYIQNYPHTCKQARKDLQSWLFLVQDILWRSKCFIWGYILNSKLACMAIKAFFEISAHCALNFLVGGAEEAFSICSPSSVGLVITDGKGLLVGEDAIPLAWRKSANFCSFSSSFLLISFSISVCDEIKAACAFTVRCKFSIFSFCWKIEKSLVFVSNVRFKSKTNTSKYALALQKKLTPISIKFNLHHYRGAYGNGCKERAF